VQSSGGNFVLVGDFGSDGLHVGDDSRGGALSVLGVCPSR